MLLAEIEGLKYHRFLAPGVQKNMTETLKSGFDYSFVVSYGEFLDNDYTLQNKNALLIDLLPDIDTIFSKFIAVNRNQVRRFDKMEALAIHKQINAPSVIYKFYAACERDRQWYPIPPSEFTNSTVFYVTYNGMPISGMSAYSHGDYMRIGRIFSLRRSAQIEQANLVFGSAAKKLVYEYCKYAKELGFKYLDLGGVDLHSDIKSGLTEFKLSFGGELVPVIIGRYETPLFAAKKTEFFARGIDIT